MCYIYPRKATAEMFVDVIVKVIRPTLIYVRTVPSRLYIMAYAGIKVHIWYISFKYLPQSLHWK